MYTSHGVCKAARPARRVCDVSQELAAAAERSLCLLRMFVIVVQPNEKIVPHNSKPNGYAGKDVLHRDVVEELGDG